MADVAHAAGVSVATVSYVLGGRRGDLAAARIGDDTRDRVLSAVESIGYRVNEPARNLRRRRTDRVLLLIDRLSSPYAQHLATEVEYVLDERGLTLSVVVCPTIERLRKALDMVRRGLADGAIVLPWSSLNPQDLLETYARDRIPMVVMSSGLSARGYDIVANDEVDALHEMVDHLVAKGHRHAAFIAHTVGKEGPDPRIVHVRERFTQHGLFIDDGDVLPGARDRNAAFATTRLLLDRPHPPTAIVSASDTGGIAAIWAAMATGRNVPDDVAVVGCGNIEECLITVPQLSSAGPEAPDFSPVARLLLDRLDNPQLVEDRHLLIPWKFFPRASA